MWWSESPCRRDNDCFYWKSSIRQVWPNVTIVYICLPRNFFWIIASRDCWTIKWRAGDRAEQYQCWGYITIIHSTATLTTTGTSTWYHSCRPPLTSYRYVIYAIFLQDLFTILFVYGNYIQTWAFWCTTTLGRRLDSDSTAHTHALATHIAPPSTPPCYTCRTQAPVHVLLLDPADSAKRWPTQKRTRP